MSKKKRNEFKERLALNSQMSKEKAKEREKKILSNKVVEVELKENLVARVDRGNYFVSSEEIKELVNDLFYTNVEVKPNTVINLDAICDVCYRLNCKEVSINEVLFQLC